MSEETDIRKITRRLLDGGAAVSKEEALRLAEWPDLDELCDCAEELKRAFMGDTVDSCSIVNARSGRCGEDCKWCAQASRHATGCQTYNILDEGEVIKAARANQEAGIQKFSFVTSGRTISPTDLTAFLDIIRRLTKEVPELYLCASMGLLSKEQMMQLKEAGVKRYHCNMETSEAYFPDLCTTHTPADKRATLQAAREAGLALCSGGIIGMGETMEQRVDLAFELAALDVDSVPINILNPIPGTPLEHQPLISEEEVIRTVATFRFILPRKSLRFAGGRMRLSHEAMLRIMTGGMNGVLMGDMLTTVSNTIADDRRLFAESKMIF